MSISQRRSPAHSARRRWIGRLTYVAAVLLLLELTARLFFWTSGKDIEVYRNFTTTRTPRMMLTDPVLGWRMQPGVTRNVFTSDFQITYRTNSLGLRDDEPAGRGGYDILFIGDSQTFGEGVPVGKRFSERVRQALPGTSSQNAGVPGYGLHQMVWLFELDGWRLEPELVVCSIIEGDLWRAVAARVTHAGPPQVLLDPNEYAWVHPRWRSVVRRLERWLRVSYVYAVFSTRAKIAWLSRQLAERDRQVWHGTTAGAHVDTQPDQPDGSSESPREALMRETSLTLLTELSESVRQAGAELLVVNVDSHSMLWLTAALQARGIPYADLANALRGAAGIRYTIDPHYNAHGHELIAAALAPAIRERFDLERRNPGPDSATLERRAKTLLAEAVRPGQDPPSSFVVEWLGLQAPRSARPGARVPVQVSFRNAAGRRWRSGAVGSGGLGGGLHNVRLGYRWLTLDGAIAQDYGSTRVDLTGDVLPGASLSLQTEVEAPDRPGRYLLQVDLVYEGVAWFEGLGAPRSVTPLEVRR